MKIGPDLPIEIQGIKFATVRDAADYFGIKRTTLHMRLKNNMPDDQLVSRDNLSKNRSAGTTPRIRRGKSVTCLGQDFASITALADHLGVGVSVLWHRIKQSGHSLDSLPVDVVAGVGRGRRNHSKKITIEEKQYPTVDAASKAYGLTKSLVSYRLKAGWTVDQAFGILPPPKRTWARKANLKHKTTSE